MFEQLFRILRLSGSYEAQNMKNVTQAAPKWFSLKCVFQKSK